MNKSKIKEPIIIIGCPRSGTSLLFTILSESKNLYSLYRESQDIFDSFYERRKIEFKEYYNDSLSEKDLTDELKDFMLNEFHRYLLNNRPIGYVIREYFLKNEPLKPLAQITTGINSLLKNAFIDEYRMVEKNPRNCFRIPFINKLFPDAKYIFLKRNGRSNISSLIEGWRRPVNYVRVPSPNEPLNIKGDKYKKWRYVLPPGWQDYKESSLEEVSAFQWISANKAALEGLKIINPEKVYSISYEELSNNTSEVIKDLCNFIEIPYCSGLKRFSEKPPVVSTPLTDKPKKDKWTKNLELLKNIYPKIEPMMKELGYSLEDEKELIVS